MSSACSVHRVLFALAILTSAVVVHSQQTQPAAIDWSYARQLNQKEQGGQALTDQEKAYLDKAKAAMKAGRGPGNAGGPGTRPASMPAVDTSKLIPLDQMAVGDTYRGQDGGLYGGGQNVPPAEHQKLSDKALARLTPLDADGKAAADGKIVLMSIGMSNTTQEFSKFKELADKDAGKNPRLVIVDAAQGGRDAFEWTPEFKGGDPWAVAGQRLTQAGVTDKQVQVVWIKQACKGPARLGDFPAHAQKLRDWMVVILNQVHARLPNCRLAFLSSRTYGGYATTMLNPEPYAYEGGFSMQWVIRAQMKGEAALNADPAKAEVKSPVVLWGPYLWTQGSTPRKSDGFSYVKDDFGPDGTHPSQAGREKIAQLMLKFFKNDPHAKPWFVGR